jgi:hypothetical protein
VLLIFVPVRTFSKALQYIATTTTTTAMKSSLLSVRSLFRNGQTDVDRYETNENYNQQQKQDDKGISETWIQDNTGRVTDNSIDEGGEEKDEGLSTQTQEEAVPSNQPKIVFSDEIPYYPIEYSCVHILTLPPQEKEQEHVAPDGQRYDTGSSFKSPQPPPLLSQTTVPIALEILLPLQDFKREQSSSLDPQKHSVQANADAMNWSLLNAIAHTLGLSRDCNVELQYDDRSLHNYGLRRRKYTRRHKRNLVVTSAVSETTTSSTTIGPSSGSTSINSLPYPTSIYRIATNLQATQITGTCEEKMMGIMMRCYITNNYLAFLFS